VLIPAALVWVVVVSIARLFRSDVGLTNTELLVSGAVIIAVLLGASWLLQIRSDRRAQQRIDDDEESARRANEVLTGVATGHPVPPLPGQRFEYTPRRATVTTTEVTAAEVAAKEDSDA
jgi:hypothetical protein